MATEQIVALELSTMAVLYRHPLDAEYELPLLVEKWTDLCADIPDEDFSAACKLYQQKEKFFPCPANIISVYEASRPAQSMPYLEILQQSSSTLKFKRSLTKGLKTNAVIGKKKKALSPLMI